MVSEGKSKGKTRGRRLQKLVEKKKLRDDGGVNHLDDAQVFTEDNKSLDVEADEQIDEVDPKIKTPFFGLVDSSELDYFKQAESTLNLNAFATSEEKTIFINSVFEEAKGKEMKLVTNQICSKLVERLILNSNDRQLKSLFKAFNGHFVALAHHKYASHCIETLLVKSAAVVEKELLNPNSLKEEQDDADGDEPFVTMENMVLYMIGEYKSYLKAMMQHVYASHVLRLILMILAGRELPSSVLSNSILRSKKSKIARKMIEIKDNADSNRAYQIPSIFFEELKEILMIIYQDLNTAKVREACINPISSPTFSLIISLEGLVLKDRPFWNLVFQKQDDPKDPKEEAFVEYLLSDPIGSHFFEAVLKQARLKNVERLFRLYMSERVVKIAKRETTGVYIIQLLLQRLKSQDLFKVMDDLVPNLNELIINNLEIAKALIDASISKKNYAKDEIIKKLLEFFNKSVNEETKNTIFIENVLHLSSSTLGNTRGDWPTAEERRRALFLEKLMAYDDTFLKLVIENFLNFSSSKTLIDMCYHGIFSHIVEQVLENFVKIDIITRRKLLNSLLKGGDEIIVNLACNSYGSHILDKLWFFTIKMNNYKDRIAKILFDNREKIKNSIYGKLVWKNWSMELYARKQYEWNSLKKQQELEYFPLPTTEESKEKESGNNVAQKRGAPFDHDKDGKKQKVRGRNRF